MKFNCKNHRVYYYADRGILCNGNWAVLLSYLQAKRVTLTYDVREMAGLIASGKSFTYDDGADFDSKLPDMDAILKVPENAMPIESTRNARIISNARSPKYAHEYKIGNSSLWLNCDYAAMLEELGYSKLVGANPDRAVFALSLDGDVMGIFMPMWVDE